MPSNVLSHLPQLMLTKKNDVKIQHEININNEVLSAVTQNKILIVDDEPYNLDAYITLLQCATQDMKGFNFKERIEQASNGKEANEVITQGY